MQSDKPDGDSAMQRFENLLSHSLSVGKKKVEDVEEIAEDIIEPTESPQADEVVHISSNWLHERRHAVRNP